MCKITLLKNFLFSVGFSAFIAAPLLAQDSLIPLEDLKPLDVGEGLINKHSFQYGLSAANTYINDSIYLKKGYFLGNYRPYFRYMLNEKHIFNTRGKTSYKYNHSLTDAQINAGTTPSTGEYAMELFNAEFNFAQHKIMMGRSFYRLGRGLLFANFADGAEYNGQFRYAMVKVMASYSAQYSGCALSVQGCGLSGQIAQKGTYDVVPGRALDVNLPDAGKRVFAAAEIHSPQYFGSSMYALALYSKDLNTAKNAKNEIYTFDPLYTGLGLSGFIVTPHLRYLTEFIYEMGSTYNRVFANVSEKTDVRAWAITADINYSLPWLEGLLKPGLVVQYAAGSGRSGKVGSDSNPALPAQENESGADNNFFYFGAYSAGLALKPKLSNLHIIRGGFQMRPLNHFYWGRNLMLSAKYSYYHKQNADYVISDPNAKVAKANVGQGLDFQFVYDFRTDLKFFYTYGLFLPGPAYLTSAENIHIHILSINLLF